MESKTSSYLSLSPVFFLRGSIAATLLAFMVSGGPGHAASPLAGAGPGSRQLVLTEDMVDRASLPKIKGLMDEQQLGSGEVLEGAASPWSFAGTPASEFPLEIVLDLKEERSLCRILFYDMNGRGNIEVYAGAPGKWEKLFVEDGVGMNKWKDHEVNVSARYLKVVKESAGAVFGELLVYELTPEGKAARAAEAKAQGEEAEILKQAQEDAKRRPLVDAGEPFGKLPLVDEITASSEPGQTGLVESVEGVSKVENILGTPSRVMAAEGDAPKYFAYRIAARKLIEPGKAYVLTVEYPEDQARTFSIINRGADTPRGIYTGHALGDVVFAYTYNNFESLDVPLSGRYETYRQLFFLNDNIAGIKLIRDKQERTFSPVGGFYVIITQPAQKNLPLSAGAAISRIRLFEVPNPEAFNQKIVFPPDPLPRRHLFYREEMADSVINSANEKERAVNQPEDWYEYHARLMNFLGMNTFSKDLLEFGNVQGWDVGDSKWYIKAKNLTWDKVVPIASKYGLDILPYYEYAGSTGQNGLGSQYKKYVRPLKAESDYTQVTWAERFKVDITDPLTLEDFKRVLDQTVIKYKDQAKFVGAWLRPRMAQIPVSFADSTLKRYNEETKTPTPVTRDVLKKDKKEIEKYYAWWFGKRLQFLEAVRNYLKEKGIVDPVVLYTCFPSEPVPAFVKMKGVFVTDQPEPWEQFFKGKEEYASMEPHDLAKILSDGSYRETLISWRGTWGAWEWEHAVPKADPENYKQTPGILLTYPFNRAYTLKDPESFENFRAPSGLAAIRHFPLNENSLDNITGYYVCDMERSGPYSMMGEALLIANGDPFYIGYLSGYIFNRGFPEYARRFNANYLALPALPSKVIKASEDPEIVVRQIDTPASGSYLAVINTGMKAKKDIVVRLPRTGRVSEPVSGQELRAEGNAIRLSLYPFELRTLRIE